MKKKIIIISVLALGVAFLPTTILLAFALMPTIAAFTVDKTVGRSRTLCVGFMNFAGAFPFLLEFWTEFGNRTIENAFMLIGDVQNILIIYSLAGGGYAIDIAVTGIMSSLIIQRANNRMETLDKRQKELVKLWGDKVTGKYRLDQNGFPIHDIDQ